MRAGYGGRHGEIFFQGKLQKRPGLKPNFPITQLSTKNIMKYELTFIFWYLMFVLFLLASFVELNTHTIISFVFTFIAIFIFKGKFELKNKPMEKKNGVDNST